MLRSTVKINKIQIAGTREKKGNRRFYYFNCNLIEKRVCTSWFDIHLKCMYINTSSVLNYIYFYFLLQLKEEYANTKRFNKSACAAYLHPRMIQFLHSNKIGADLNISHLLGKCNCIVYHIFT